MPNQQNTILYILLYYYIIVATILYYINITLLLNIIYIYIIIHISYPADRNCAPKRRNNAYFGVIRSCLICVDSASDDFGPF